MWFRRKLQGGASRRSLRFREAEKRGENIAKLTHLKRGRFPVFPPLHRFLKTAKRALIVLGIFIAVFGTAYFVVFSSFVHAQKIIYKKGETEVPKPPFASIVAPLIGNNMFFLPTAPLEMEILKKYPDEIKKIAISREFPGAIVVAYEEFTETANVIIRLKDQQKKFILNEKGLVIAEDTENPELPYITLDAEEFPKLKTMLIPQPYLAAMAKAASLFTDKFGMKVNEVQYKKREREAHLVTERGFRILLDLTEDVEAQLFKLKRSLSKINIFEDPLDYIDLRISGQTGDKVIFKKRTK